MMGEKTMDTAKLTQLERDQKRKYLALDFNHRDGTKETVSVQRALGKFAIVQNMLSEGVKFCKVDWEKKECEELPLDEPLYLLRARDVTAVETLKRSLALCVAFGCNKWQLERIQEYITAFEEFAINHPDRMKQPGVTFGALKGSNVSPA